MYRFIVSPDRTGGPILVVTIMVLCSAFRINECSNSVMI
jgi:hypothetical protein